LLPALDDELVTLALRAKAHTSVSDAIRVERLLVERGFGNQVAEENHERFAELSRHFLNNPWIWMRRYYELLRTNAIPGELTSTQRWRLGEISAMTRFLALSELGVETVQRAFDRHSDEMRVLIPLLARLGGLDSHTLAAEAAIAADIHDAGHENDAAALLFVPPPPDEELDLHPTTLAIPALNAVMGALKSGLELPFTLATRVLLIAEDAGIPELVLDNLHDVPPWHRGRAARLAVTLSSNESDSALALLSDGDAAVRVSAADMVAELATLGSNDDRIAVAIDSLAASSDFSVRAALLWRFSGSKDIDLQRLLELGHVPPDGWTCGDCGVLQNFSDFDCKNCRSGTRADLPVELRDLVDWYQHPI
jgi:hypothetical protein